MSPVERKSLYNLPRDFFDKTYTTSETDDGKYILLDDQTSSKQVAVWKVLVCEPKKKEVLFVSNRDLFLHPNDRQPEPPKLTVVDKLARIHKIMIMLGHGGYFSASIFENGRNVCHKSFHRYITRRKQGGRQSKRDASGHCRSGGAQIRRYNEEKHDEEIHELIRSWKMDIDTSDLIFIHLPGKNKLTTFDETILKKDDSRIRTIPFPVHRPKTGEVKRVYNQLITMTFFNDRAEVEGVDLSQSSEAIELLDGTISDSDSSGHDSDKEEGVSDEDEQEEDEQDDE